MAGKKGMKHFGEAIIKEVKQMREQGMTNGEIAVYYGFESKEVIRTLLKRERKKETLMEKGIIPNRKGRPRKGYAKTQEHKDDEIKRLKMENELLRSFLQNTGRR